MSPQATPQVRELMVKWHEDGMRVSSIAALSGFSKRTVYNVLNTYRDYGQLSSPFTQIQARPRSLDTGDINYLAALLLANPTLYLDELQDLLYQVRGIDISIATISRAIHQLSLSNKKISKAAMERDELLRATWQAEYGDIPMEYFIWLDESGVDDHTNQRTNGWAPFGCACVQRATFMRGQRYSVLPALTTDGIIALDIFEGSVNKERFVGFLEDQLAPQLTPYPGPRSVAVMDNCAIHHDEDIRAIVEDECGAKLIYLPPYSPDMNPIEQAFHSLKAWLRRHECEAVMPAVHPWLIYQATQSITAQDAEGWILNCGYS